jgi:heme/copper-type cytochrome/quinol oxidase subunit 3
VSTILDAPPGSPPRARRANGQRLPPPLPPTGGDDGPEGEPERRGTAIDNVVLATMFFIGGEVMLFGGLVFGFWILRLAAPVWPPPLQPRLPVEVTGLNTLVLLASSAAVVAAGRALAAGDGRRAVARFATAAGLGVLFLLVQGYEWVRLIGFGLTGASGTYGTTFYTLIGAHAAHVLGALVWLVIMTVLTARGRFMDGRKAPLRACAIYWHFVVALWPVLYVSVYVL